MAGAALLEEEDAPPINELVPCVVLPDPAAASAPFEESDDPSPDGVLLSAERSVSGVGD